MSLRLRTWTFLAAAILDLGRFPGSNVRAQDAQAVVRGTWTATAGSQTLRGSWGAGLASAKANAAQGYWTLVNESDERVLEGTWSARKMGTRWHGTWSARTAKGQSFSGVWDADIRDAKVQTFAEMLTQTLEKEIAGSWQSGRYGGNWWLRGSRTAKGVR